MNINTNNSVSGSDTKTTRSRSGGALVEPTQTATSSPAPVKSAADQVQLSQEAQKLGQLQAKINASPDVNLEKVNEIRRAIAEGKFHVNPERIADALLNQEELLG